MKNRNFVLLLVSLIAIVVISLLSLLSLFKVIWNEDTKVNDISQDHDASIKFDKVEHDFGIINESDGSASYSFEFINDGTSALLIHDILVSCGCTTPEWTKEPIEPGQKGFVKAIYDPNQRPGVFTKSLKILSNACVQETKLKIKGNVVPIARDPKVEYPIEIGGLRLKYQSVSFETITKEKIVTTSFQVYNATDKEMRFSEQYTAPDHIKLNFSPQRLPSKAVGTIEWFIIHAKLNFLGLNRTIFRFRRMS